MRDSSSGRLTVVLTDARASDGVVDFRATAKAPMPAALPPYRVTVVLGGDTLGGNDAGAAGACAVHVFQCTSAPTGARFKCR